MVLAYLYIASNQCKLNCIENLIRCDRVLTRSSDPTLDFKHIAKSPFVLRDIDSIRREHHHGLHINLFTRSRHFAVPEIFPNVADHAQPCADIELLSLDRFKQVVDIHWDRGSTFPNVHFSAFLLLVLQTVL